MGRDQDIKEFKEEFGIEENYDNNKINVLDDIKSIKIKTWKNVKKGMLDLNQGSENLYFIAHKEDEIIGKPQELYQVKQKVVLITQARKYVSDSQLQEFKDKYIFLDDSYDKRYDGVEHKVLGFYFWIYRIVEDGIEYMVLSEKELDPQQHRLRGMKIDLKDSSELTKTLKLKTISKLFISVENEPSIKAMPKTELIEFVKKLGISKGEYIEYLYTHPLDHKVYSHSQNYSRIRIYQELSGKYEGYPLHLMIWGDVGRGKTIELECIDDKFNEERGIYEAGSSTLKGLIPSYSEKPANVGHILKCLRRSLIDEVNKMFSKTQNYEIVSEYLGQLNFLLEHKDREVGSGNYSFRAKATSKITLATNGFGNKKFLHEHIGVIDPTTLSRILHLVVNREEYDYIKKNRLKKSVQKKLNNHIFLSIYDSCQSFLVDYDEEKVREIFEKGIEKAEKLKRVWEGRGLHHSILLLDGIVKYRCLFEGDKSFKAISEDYEELENVLNYLIENWNYCLKID